MTDLILRRDAVLFFAGVTIVYHFEAAGNPIMSGLPIIQAGNMEGKEVRFGIANSALFAAVITGASCGAVNSMANLGSFGSMRGEGTFNVIRSPTTSATFL